MAENFLIMTAKIVYQEKNEAIVTDKYYLFTVDFASIALDKKITKTKRLAADYH